MINSSTYYIEECNGKEVGGEGWRGENTADREGGGDGHSRTFWKKKSEDLKPLLLPEVGACTIWNEEKYHPTRKKTEQ